MSMNKLSICIVGLCFGNILSKKQSFMNAKSRAHFPSSEPDRDPPCWARQCPDSQLHCRRFGQNIESSCCCHPRRSLVNDLPPPKRPGNLQQWLVQHLHWQQQQQSNIDTEQCLIYFALFDLFGNLACWLFAKIADIEAKQFTTGDRHWFVCGVGSPTTHQHRLWWCKLEVGRCKVAHTEPKACQKEQGIYENHNQETMAMFQKMSPLRKSIARF